MPIPDLDTRGLLPAGIHAGNWAEIERRFAVSAYREDLLRRAKSFICEPGMFWQEAEGLEIWLGGSFFSDKARPGDIECTVAMSLATVRLRGGLLALALQRKEIKEQFGVDLAPSIEGKNHNDLRDYFQYVGPKTAAEKGLNVKDRRGIVRVEQWTIG